MLVTLADPSLVLLIGPSGCGKSAFAKRHFHAAEILSSDFCRALVCNDESDQSATNDAFELLHLILAKRLQRRLTTVVDATNVQIVAREPLALAAKQAGIPVVAIVFLLAEDICRLRNSQRQSRQVPPDVVQKHTLMLRESFDHLGSEGLEAIFLFRTPADVESVLLSRHPAHS